MVMVMDAAWAVWLHLRLESGREKKSVREN